MCRAPFARSFASGVCVQRDHVEVFVVALPLTLAPRPEFCDKFEAVLESRRVRSAGSMVPCLGGRGPCALC